MDVIDYYMANIDRQFKNFLLLIKLSIDIKNFRTFRVQA